MMPVAITKLHITRRIAWTLFFIVVFPSACVSHYDFLSLDSIPEVPSGIPDRFVGLRVAFLIRRAHCQRISPGRLCGPRRLPGAKGVRAMILSAFCGHPGFPVVIRDFHEVHAAKPTESNAL